MLGYQHHAFSFRCTSIDTCIVSGHYCTMLTSLFCCICCSGSNSHLISAISICITLNSFQYGTECCTTINTLLLLPSRRCCHCCRRWKAKILAYSVLHSMVTKHEKIHTLHDLASRRIKIKTNNKIFNLKLKREKVKKKYQPLQKLCSRSCVQIFLLNCAKKMLKDRKCYKGNELNSEQVRLTNSDPIETQIISTNTWCLYVLHLFCSFDV